MCPEPDPTPPEVSPAADLFGPGKRMRRLARALGADAQPGPTQLERLGGLEADDARGRRLSVDADLLNPADIGCLRHWLNRGFGRELHLWGSQADSEAARALSLEPGARFLAWPPSAAQLERLAEDAPRQRALCELGPPWERLCRQLLAPGASSRSGPALRRFAAEGELALRLGAELPPALPELREEDLGELFEDCLASASLAGSEVPHFQLRRRPATRVLAPAGLLRALLEDACRLALHTSAGQLQLRARVAPLAHAPLCALELELAPGELACASEEPLWEHRSDDPALDALLRRLRQGAVEVERAGGSLSLEQERPGRLLLRLELLSAAGAPPHEPD